MCHKGDQREKVNCRQGVSFTDWGLGWRSKGGSTCLRAEVGADPRQQEWQVNKHTSRDGRGDTLGGKLPLRVKGRGKKKLQKQKWGEEALEG